MSKRPLDSKKRALAVTSTKHEKPTSRLDAAERAVLQEALRRGEDLREQVEANVTAYGRWLIGAVFRDDAGAALDGKKKNRVWQELLRRAGGPTLQISRHMLYVSLRIAAHDKRITDQAWRGLDSGRKELLLPLGNDDALRKAAQHVAKWNLTQASTRAYVAEELKGSGKRPATRLTVPQVVTRVKKLRAVIDKPELFRRLEQIRLESTPAERAQAIEEIDRLSAALTKVAHALRAKR